MKKTYFTIIIITLVIGFATVTTNLIINGKINIGFNQQQFENDVIFTKAISLNGEAVINEGSKSITYNTGMLKNVDEESVLDFNVTNKSLNYDATVNMNCYLKDGETDFEEFISISKTLDDEFTLAAGETKSGRLNIKLVKAYNDSLSKDINMECKLIASPVERDETATYNSVDVYKEEILNGADPVLSGELIPVNIDDQGHVTYADITKEWYDYETKQWANAVILTNNKNLPEVGEEIKEQDIESYFVWIPKYKYQLWNVDTTNPTHNSPFEIQVQFGLNDTSDEIEGECTTPLNEERTQALSGSNGNCQNDEWMTHPAFITMGVNGLWVGKFETGYKDALGKENAEVDALNPAKVIVKPNVYSWRASTHYNVFYTLKGYKENLNSHMMKNTEWGAVAYLSHSKYGVQTDLGINQHISYITGYSAMTAPYPKNVGFDASTTGNITGIYDMVGGAYEEVMGVVTPSNANENYGGFTLNMIKSVDSRLYDLYNSNSSPMDTSTGILGDATREMGPFTSSLQSSWYNDNALYSLSSIPYFVRGMSFDAINNTQGLFAFNASSGSRVSASGSRLVLAPTN